MRTSWLSIHTKNIPDGVMPVQTLSEEQMRKFNADGRTKIKDMK